ncbi:MAG: ABC transporter substrate-binding protein, partial [Thermoprotei archaeon]
MLSKAIKSLFVLLVFSFSFFAFVPNPVSGQTTSIPGPTLYLYSVTSTPYTNLDEIPSDGYSGFIYSSQLGPVGALLDMQPWLGLLNGTVIPNEFVSYKEFLSNNTYIVILRPGLKWSNGYPLNSTTFYDMFLALVAIGSPPDIIKIINSTALLLQVPPPGISAGSGFASPSWVFGPEDGLVPTATYPPYWAPFMKPIEGNYSQFLKYNATVYSEFSDWIFDGAPSKLTPPQYPLVSNGPYEVESVTPSEIVLIRNPYYWDKSAWPWNSVVVYQFTSATTAESYLLSGKIDIWSGDIPTSISSELPSYIKMGLYPNGALEGLYFNFNSNWVSQLPVREAIAYAINRTQVAMAADPSLTLYKPTTYPINVPVSILPTFYNQSYLDSLNAYAT